MNGSRRKLRNLAALPAALALLVAVPGSAGAQQAGAYALFNLPSAGSADTAIEDHIVELANGAPEGSVIHGAMFTWTRPAVAEALADAQARGVQVHLAVDSQGSGGANAEPGNEAIKALRDANLTELVFCEGTNNSSCIGDRDGSINHNKSFTFSATGDKRDVVLASSHNLTTSQTRSYNNAVVVHDDKAFYDDFVRHLGNVLKQEKDRDYYNNSPVGHIHSDTSKADAYFSPRADSNGGTEPEAATDTVAEILATMKSAEDGCSVDVAQAMFTGPRLPVANELIRIGKLGCQVRVVGGNDMSDYINDKLAGQQNVTVRRPLPELHSKYLVVQGNLGGQPGRSMVLAGSHNLTGPSLRSHDETLLGIEQDAVSEAFAGNFSTLWKAAG